MTDPHSLIDDLDRRTKEALRRAETAKAEPTALSGTPGMTRASRFADEGSLASQMQDLGSAARKHVDNLPDATAEVRTTAGKRATAGKKIDERGAPGTHAQKKAAHDQAKKRHTAAQANVVRHTDALADIAHQAQEIADDVNRLRRQVAADKLTAATNHGAVKAAKEVVVQGSNQDQRAGKAEQGHRDQHALLNNPQEPVEESQREARETWQVRGTLDL